MEKKLRLKQRSSFRVTVPSLRKEDKKFIKLNYLEKNIPLCPKEKGSEKNRGS